MFEKASRKLFWVVCVFGLAAGFVLYFCNPVLATTYYVNPGESIQAAIDGASYGDTVEVSAGTYWELITLKNGVVLIGASQLTTTIYGFNGGTVVITNGCDPNTVLEGFTITEGLTTEYGGGMRNVSSNPTVTNCTFSNNGGYNPLGSIYGGGMYNSNYSSPIVTGCTFIDNGASCGGGMFNGANGNPIVTNCSFWENGAGVGGGMYNSGDSNPTVTNCTFNGNDALGDGGGMYNRESSTTVTNCILWGNTDSGPQDESAQIYNLSSSTTTINYSCVQGWTGAMGGEGNIGDDPLFVYGSNLSNLRLLPDSPCIDTGDNDSVPIGVMTDLDGLPRIMNLSVDIGAYESQDIVVLCVDIDAAGANNGTNWLNAFNYLQDGLAEADYGYKIVVAEGTYRSDEDNNDPSGTGDRTTTFDLISGVEIYGGFPSGGGTWDQRDPNRYETILSGDLLENDGPDFTNNGENSYHVVTTSGVDPNAILDGFTITSGNANGGDTDGNGGGMFNDNSNLTVVHCDFVSNSAVFGGGIRNENNSNATIINCRFFTNSGGLSNESSNPAVTNCLFSGNSASNGGGMHNRNSSPAVTNCTFSNNDGVFGGGLYSQYGFPVITNCIFWGNTASYGGAGSEVTQIYTTSSNPVVTYCCIQGLDSYFGNGNVGTNPTFRDADGDDDIVGTKDDNLQLSYDSPCIDAGDSSSLPADSADLDDDGDTTERTALDLAYNDRFTDDPIMPDTGVDPLPIVDMGTYERYEFCGSEVYPYRLGDANGDCHFDLADIAIIASQWLDYYGPE